MEIIDNVPINVKSILDVGCGWGDMGGILSGKGYEVDGITLSAEEAEHARLLLRTVYIHNLESGLPMGIPAYDLVVCSHVLEHIAYPGPLLKAIGKCLNPEGRMLVALPNIMHYQSRFELVRGNFLSRESGIWDNTHLRWYTYRSARQLLVDNGFRVERAWVAGDIPFMRAMHVIPSAVRRVVFKGLTTISKGLFGQQLLFQATVKR